jgi:hypothetical protein
MNTEISGQRDLFPFTAFLATAARSGLEEGVFTATYRLVDTIRRLIELFPEMREDEFFQDVDEFLKKNLSKAYLMSEEQYTAFLDELLQCFAVEIRKRNGLDGPA